jgi:GntR family transcriptional regulator
MKPQSRPVTLERLGIALDRDAEVPLGVQLAWALRARIHAGALASGERLPALRDLAEALGVNSNTIRAVYQRLEHEGLLASLQGSGTFVTAGPREGSAAGAIAAAAAHEARETGVDPREVAAALYVAQEERPAQAGGSPLARAGALPAASELERTAPEGAAQTVRRRRLRAQIAALEQALVDLEVQHPRLARIPPAHERPGDGPRLLDTAELERVQTELLRRIAALQTAIDDRLEGRSGAAEEPQPQPTLAAKPRAAAAAKPKARPRAITRPAATGT